MSKLSKKKFKLGEIINNNNLCISNNPKGIDINWPKSFARLYYSQYLENVYKITNSPIILEINQENLYKKKLWELFFDNPIIFKFNIYNQKNFNDFNNLNSSKKFDIIIIQNYKKIVNINKIINNLKNKLKPKGTLIVENVYFSFPLVLRLFLFQQTRIFDFRIDRFILDNCIIEIKNNGEIMNIISFFIGLKKLFIHLLIEILYILVYKIKNLLK